MNLREMIGRRLPTERSHRSDYFAVHEHRQEAERMALVLDDVLQSDTDRSTTDLALIGILHALLSRS